MNGVTHNLAEINRPGLVGFGQHIATLPKSDRIARIAQLKQVLLEAGRELEQLLAEG